MTIVVLLILAGITITMLFGENGIIKKAQDAADATKNDQDATINGLKNLEDQMNAALDENDGGSGGGTVVAKVTDLTADYVTGNTPAQDEFGNRIVIPDGFKVVLPSEDSTVVYKDPTKPNVTDGIVIQDNSEDHNQFVWIPVGNIKDGTDTPKEVKLARYKFNAQYNSSTSTIDGDGTILQTVEDGSALRPLGYSYDFLEQPKEDTTYLNVKAYDIEGFKTSAKNAENGGYYLARFEASKGTGDKVKSKSGAVWNNVRQSVASQKSKEMYTGKPFVSDLVNSYAWDTAIVFIQTFSGDTDYAKQNSKNRGSRGNTGERSGTTDKVLNIYDMASNTREWSTETFTLSGYPCVFRGGSYGYSSDCTSIRGSYSTSNSDVDFSFRPLLYISSPES